MALLDWLNLAMCPMCSRRCSLILSHPLFLFSESLSLQLAHTHSHSLIQYSLHWSVIRENAGRSLSARHARCLTSTTVLDVKVLTQEGTLMRQYETSANKQSE